MSNHREGSAMIDWYERRHDLRPEQVFRLHGGDVVKLDQGVPGDGTKWYAAEWDDRHKNWAYYDFEIEPGDLKERLPDDFSGENIEAGHGSRTTQIDDRPQKDGGNSWFRI